MGVAALNWTLLTILSIGKDKTKYDRVEGSIQIRSRWQNILTKLLGVIGQTRNATTPFEAWKFLRTDET